MPIILAIQCVTIAVNQNHNKLMLLQSKIAKQQLLLNPNKNCLDFFIIERGEL